MVLSYRNEIIFIKFGVIFNKFCITTLIKLLKFNKNDVKLDKNVVLKAKMVENGKIDKTDSFEL